MKIKLVKNNEKKIKFIKSRYKIVFFNIILYSRYKPTRTLFLRDIIFAHSNHIMTRWNTF